MSDFTFESGMQALEALVKALESGQMGLEESFEAYAKAIALRDRLTALLDEGDRRIRALTETGEREIPPEEILRQEDLV